MTTFEQQKVDRRAAARKGRAACLLAAAAVSLGLTACGSAPVVLPEPEPFAITLPPDRYDDGAIYHPASGFALFEDVRARNVGDVLYITLDERTDATNSSSTSTKKTNAVEVANPTIFGNQPTRNGTPLLEGRMNSNNTFAGEGSSRQSNSLEGSVAVVVVGRLNQSREFIRVSGIVRPVDIEPDNTISSFRLADARIDYGGVGALADANKMNWLARFFNSPWMPF